MHRRLAQPPHEASATAFVGACGQRALVLLGRWRRKLHHLTEWMRDRVILTGLCALVCMLMAKCEQQIHYPASADLLKLACGDHDAFMAMPIGLVSGVLLRVCYRLVARLWWSSGG